jgi:hypothetical protein
MSRQSGRRIEAAVPTAAAARRVMIPLDRGASDGDESHPVHALRARHTPEPWLLREDADAGKSLTVVRWDLEEFRRKRRAEYVR